MKADEDKQLLQVLASCKLHSFSESDKEAFTLECRFLLRYAYKGAHPHREELADFAESIVKFNAWPCFRECLQSLAQRMQFNPPPLPILKVLPKAGKPAKKKLKSVR